MGLRDKISDKAEDAVENAEAAKEKAAGGMRDAKETATENLSQAKDSVTETASDAKETASETVDDLTDSIPSGPGTGRLPGNTVPDPTGSLSSRLKYWGSLQWRYTANGVRNPASRTQAFYERLAEQPVDTLKRKGLGDPELMEQIIAETEAAEVEISHPFADMSYPDFAGTAPQVGPAARTYGKRAVEFSKEVEFEETYRYGRDGAKAGAKYGDYIPVVGDFAPYLGAGVGVLLSIANASDRIDAEDILDAVGPMSDAADEVIDDEDADLGEKIVRGGVVYADSRYGDPSGDDLDDLLDMDFDEFAGKS
jgi:hypothetical protein